METFFSLLSRHVQTCNSLLCVGLDPHPEDLPKPSAEAARDFCVRLVRATVRYAAAYKPNAAFFELYGPAGWAALKEVIDAVRTESHRMGSVLPVILDAKRGDIASTASAYAHSAFNELGVHAITLSPYLGQDSLTPFLTDREKGVFLLCKTSNSGASDLQDLPLANGLLLHEQVADLAQTWNTSDNIGLVVGATQPETLARLRARVPNMWFLAPGVGAQGADLEQALSAGLRPDGQGMLVAVSRALSRAADPKLAAADLRDHISTLRYNVTRSRQNVFHSAAVPASKETSLQSPVSNLLPAALLKSGCVKFGQFTLKSGQQSPIYLDLRQLVSHPEVLQIVAQAYAEKLRSLTFDRLAGIPYAALPIATAISLAMQRPLIYPRREAKDYGTKANIEGEYQAGETIVVIDDLATTGGTKIESIQKLADAGLKVKDIVVLIDREQGAAQTLAEAGYTLHAVTTLPALLTAWLAAGAITATQAEEVRAFLKGG